MGLEKIGLYCEVVLISSGLNSDILLYVSCAILCSSICIVRCIRGVYNNLLPDLANTTALFIVFLTTVDSRYLEAEGTL